MRFSQICVTLKVEIVENEMLIVKLVLTIWFWFGLEGTCLIKSDLEPELQSRLKTGCKMVRKLLKRVRLVIIPTERQTAARPCLLIGGLRGKLHTYAQFLIYIRMAPSF